MLDKKGRGPAAVGDEFSLMGTRGGSESCGCAGEGGPGGGARRADPSVSGPPARRSESEGQSPWGKGTVRISEACF